MHFFIMEVFCKKYMIFAFNVKKIHAELCKTLNIVDEVYDYFIRKKPWQKKPFLTISLFCNSHSMYAFAICYKCKLNIALTVWGTWVTLTHLIYVFSSPFEITMKLMKMTVLIAFSS